MSHDGRHLVLDVGEHHPVLSTALDLPLAWLLGKALTTLSPGPVSAGTSTLPDGTRYRTLPVETDYGTTRHVDYLIGESSGNASDSKADPLATKDIERLQAAPTSLQEAAKKVDKAVARRAVEEQPAIGRSAHPEDWLDSSGDRQGQSSPLGETLSTFSCAI
ncbi:hypothetical protein AB0I22_37885 [Streptomyces sp. NPDC050610]|uniref:hypothetical protein n=1 Tax=Streptomyces sp. NPDC050610 TaxID=3157097 RepID=UPI00342D086E